MAVNKRDNGRWQAKIRGLDGVVWWSLTVDTKREAERVEREMCEALNRGEKWTRPRDRKRAAEVSLVELVNAYLTNNADRWSPRTIRAYGFALAAFVDWADRRGLGVEALDEEPIRAWLADMVDAKPTSRRSRVATVCACWRWVAGQAPRRGWAGIAPFVRIRQRPVPRARTFAPTWEEMDLLIAALQPKKALGRGSEVWFRVAILQRFTGARVTEATLLQWSDWDEAAALLRFRPEITKGGYGGREIPVSPHLAAWLTSWARTSASISGASPGQSHRCSRTFTRAWLRSGARPQVWQRQPTHALRKGVVSGLRRLRADPAAVEVFVGHVIPAVQSAYLDQAMVFNMEELAALIPPLSVTLSVSP